MRLFSHVSPSQIDTFHVPAGGCNRKWFLQKIVGLPIPQAASAALGEAVHSTIEGVLEEKPGAVLHPLAQPAKSFIDSLRGKVMVERKMDRKLPNGLDFTGRIDVLDFRTGPHPRVIDWKTTSALQYAKTSEELAKNIQMISYAYEAIQIEPNAPAVTVAHGVLLTRGAPQFRYTEATIPKYDIYKGWSDIITITSQMKKVAEIPSAADVTPNWKACDRFGGCHFRDRCKALKGISSNVNPYAEAEAEAQPQENPNMASPLPPSLMAKLGVKTQPAAAPATPARATGVVPPDAPASPKEEASAVAALLAKKTEPAKAVDPVKVIDGPAKSDLTEAERVTLLVGNGWSDDEIDSLSENIFLLLSDEGVKRADVESLKVDADDSIVGFVRKAAEPAAPARRSRVAAAATPAVEPEPVVEAQPEPTPEPVAEPEVPKRRGRPPGAKNKASVVEPAATVEVTAETEVKQETEAPPPAVAYYDMLTLYVDCLPEKGSAPILALDTLVAPYMDAAAKNYVNEKTGRVEPLTHYLLIPFARGPGLVAAYLVANPPKGAVYVDSRSPCAAACLEVLRPMADVIISARGR